MRAKHDVPAGVALAIDRRSSSLPRPWSPGATIWILAALLVAGLPSATGAVPQGEAGDGQAVTTGPDRADKANPDEVEGAKAGEATGEAEAAAASQASDVPQAEGRVLGTVQLSGVFQIGVRGVDVNGAENYYREDYDLDSGPRLLGTRLVIRPVQRTAGRLFDRVVVDATGVGGDPYESWGVSAYKTGAYNFRVRGRTVDYFYERLGDVHDWDVTRNHLDMQLTANATEDVQLFANFNRFRQEGFRLTTRDETRDEFHFDEPLDQDGTTLGFGVRWHIDTTDLFFTQEFVHFNDNAGFTSGPQAGGPTATFIESLSHSEVRAMDAPISRGGFHTLAAAGRVEINGDFLYSRQTMGFDFVRQWEGLDRFSNPVEVTADNSGAAKRLVRHANLSARVRAHERVFVTGRYRHRDWDQSGDSIGEDIFLLTEEGTFSIDRGSAFSSYRVKADQFMFGAEVMATDAVTVFGEVGFSQKDKRFDKDEFGDFPRGSDRQTDITTETTAFRIGGVVRPDRRIDVKVTYDRGDIDDPLTQIFPTETDSLKLRARVRPMDAWTIAGHVTYRTVDNTLTDYELTAKSFGGSVTYARDERGHVTIGYSRQDWDSQIPFVFVLDDRSNGTSVSAYASESNVFTAVAEHRVSSTIPLNIYGSLAIVDNNGTLPSGAPNGTLPLRVYDGTIGGRYTFPRGFFVDIQGRFIDYRQELFHEQGIILSSDEPSTVNDYDAKIFTVGVGLNF